MYNTLNCLPCNSKSMAIWCVFNDKISQCKLDRPHQNWIRNSAESYNYSQKMVPSEFLPTQGNYTLSKSHAHAIQPTHMHRDHTRTSGGSRGGSMGSLDPPF